MNADDTVNNIESSRLNDARTQLSKLGFKAEQSADGTWSIVGCALPDPLHRHSYPELIGLDVSAGWKDESEALKFARSHLWQRLEPLERLYREFESAWCHFKQVDNGWRAIGSTGVEDDRVFSSRGELLEKTQEFVRDEKIRQTKKRLANAGLPEVLFDLDASESEQELALLLLQSMREPNQGWVVLCGKHARTIACTALVAAVTDDDYGARLGNYVSAWDAIQDPDSFADVLSSAKFVVLDMTTLIPGKTAAELGERITYLMRPAIEALFRMRLSGNTVIVSDFSVETLKRLLGKQLLAWYGDKLRFIDSGGQCSGENPFRKSHS